MSGNQVLGLKKEMQLARVMKSALCIYCGSADVEWSLLDKKMVTDERTRLSEAFITSLRMAKDFVHAPDDNFSKVTITKEVAEAGKKSPQDIQLKLGGGERGS